MLNGELYQLKSNPSLVIGRGKDADLEVTEVISGQVVRDVGPQDLKKITLNNRMRGLLKAAMALSLIHI